MDTAEPTLRVASYETEDACHCEWSVGAHQISVELAWSGEVNLHDSNVVEMTYVNRTMLPPLDIDAITDWICERIRNAQRGA